MGTSTVLLGLCGGESIAMAPMSNDDFLGAYDILYIYKEYISLDNIWH